MIMHLINNLSGITFVLMEIIQRSYIAYDIFKGAGVRR